MQDGNLEDAQEQGFRVVAGEAQGIVVAGDSGNEAEYAGGQKMQLGNQRSTIISMLTINW
jgi:hypothetical protein